MAKRRINKNFKSLMDYKKGFTIIELVIVISVLIVLIGITVPRMKGMQDQSKITKAKGELSTLQAAVESYYSFTGNYPVSCVANKYGGQSGLGDWQNPLVGAAPQILSSVLNDPRSNSSYEYEFYCLGSYYVISSLTNPGGTVTIDTNGLVFTGSAGGSVICLTNGKGC